MKGLIVRVLIHLFLSAFASDFYWLVVTVTAVTVTVELVDIFTVLETAHHFGKGVEVMFSSSLPSLIN